MKRTDLNRLIYLQARANCAWKNSEEAIRTIRDNAVMTVTQWTRGDKDKTADYKLCTEAELQGVLDYLKYGVRVLEGLAKTEAPKRNRYATDKQKKSLFYNVFACGVYYAATDERYVDENTGELLEGEALKQWRIRCFDSGNRLPRAVVQTIYNWAVPKIWQTLVEGSFRTLPRGCMDYSHPRLTKITWNEITREEADAIIKCFRAMNNVLESTYKHTQHKTKGVYYG